MLLFYAIYAKIYVMTTELLPVDVTEADPHAPVPNLDAVSTDSVEAMRDMQRTQISVARQHALSEHDVVTQGYNTADVAASAEADAISSFDRDIDEFVHARVCSRDDNPDVHGRVVAMLRDASVDRMDDEEWYLGEASEPTEEDGIPLHNNLATSGKSQHQTALDALRTELGLDDEGDEGEDDPEDDEDDEPDDPLSEEQQQRLENLQAEIGNLRGRLAALSVERRRLITDRGQTNRKLEARYSETQLAYSEALQELGQLRSLVLSAENLTADEFQHRVVEDVLTEHRNFTNAEFAHMQHDSSRKARLIRWMADHKFGHYAVSAGSGAVLGGATKAVKAGLVASLSVGAAAVTIPAALGVKTVGAIYRGGVGNQVTMHREFEKRRQHDNQQLQSVFDESDVAAHHSAGYDSLVATIGGRIEEDQKSNRRRVIGGAILGAAGFGVALAAGELVSNIGSDGSSAKSTLTSDSEAKPTSTSENTGRTDGHPAASAQSTPEPAPGQNPNHDSHGENKSTSTGTDDKSSEKSTSDLNANVTVEAGHGITHELEDLAEQQMGIQLTGAEAWEAYQHLNETVDGNLFTNNETYRMDDGSLGIANTGATTWDPRALEEFERWLAEQHPEKVKSNS